MRCTWFAKANCVSQALVHSRPRNVSLRALLSLNQYSFRPASSFTRHLFLPKPPAPVTYTSSTTAWLASSHLPTHIRHHSTSPNVEAENRLSPAQFSRSACKAIRLSAGAGDLPSAWFVFHSIRQTHTPNKWGTRLSTEQLLKDNMFDQPIPPRLSAHTLLHAMLRLGLRQRAYRLTQQLLAEGVRVHGRTLEAIVHGILDPAGKPSTVNGEFLVRWNALLPTRQVLHLSPASSTNPSIRCAIQLLQAAREYNHQRSERMFSAVIKACLLHGELLAASLIFTAIIKACTVKDSIPAGLSENAGEQSTMQSIDDLAEPQPLFPRLPPHAFMMKSIVNSIVEAIREEKNVDDNGALDSAFLAALQALANLACLLDLRLLPFGDLACLVQALYSCPKVNNKVWVLSCNGDPKQVRAYDYFHRVLMNLTNHLPPLPQLNSGRSPPLCHSSKPPSPHTLKSQRASKYTLALKKRSSQKAHQYDPSRTPVLDMCTCNSLLHYALRHRLSVDLGQKVMAYINKHHSADVVTLNILMSSGRLLRLPDLAEGTLARLRFQLDGESRNFHVPPVPSILSDLPSHDGGLVKAVRRLANDQPEKLLDGLEVQNADHYTLSEYITFLVSTGSAKLVSKVVFDLFPELKLVGSRRRRRRRSRADANVPNSVKHQRLKMHADCLRRVVPFGPYFFVAFLNALRKAGQVALAERVWVLAKQAERASWKYKYGKDKPWVLPTHAYTVMIQCYSKAALQWRNPVASRRILGSQMADPSGENGGYIPFMARAGTVYRQLGEVRSQVEGLSGNLRNKWTRKRIVSIFSQIPKPDARLFNAMMEITTRNPMMRRRRNRSPAHWRRHIYLTRWEYAKMGRTRGLANGYVEELVEDLTAHGFSVPIGLQYLFVRREPASMPRERKTKWRALDCGPYVYPPLPRTDSPFTLATGKTKGLPLRRKGRRRPPSKRWEK